MRWLLVVALCSPALAQEQPQQPPEKKVIVTASPLNPKDVYDTPYSTDVVTGDDAETRRLSRTVPDALRETPGVSVQKTSSGHGSPVIRGFTGFRNLFLIDGIRLNNSVFREGPNQYWNTVDEFLIDRLDIVRGPSSVLYGSDSIGGTVNAFTKEPADFEPGLHPHAREFGRFAGAEHSYTSRTETWGNDGGFGWFAGATYRDFGDIDGGGHVGRMPHTGYDEYDLDAKLVYSLSKDAKLVLALQHARQEGVPRTHRTIYSRSWHGTTVGTDLEQIYRQERDLGYLQYHARYQGALVDAVDASLSFSRTGETFRRTKGTLAREFRELTVDTPALWARAGKSTAIGYVTVGAEYYRDFVDSAGEDTSSAGVVTTFARGDVADDATYDLFGIYVQDEYTVGALDVTPGVRFTWARVDAQQVDPTSTVVFGPLEDTYRAVTGSLRLLYRLTPEWNAIGGWGMGFRTPSLDDTTAIKLVLSGALDLPSENLRPEKSHTFDLGLRTRHPKWEATGFVFTTILRDFIRRVPDGDFNGDGITDFAKENFARGWVWGFELGGLYRVTEEVSLFGDWAYVKARAEALVAGEKVERPLDKVNPNTVHLGVRYEPKGTGVWVEGLATVVDSQHALGPADETDTQRIPPGGTPGYVIFGVRGGWRISENVAVSAAVDNITNRDYRVHGSGQNEPGTNFIAGLDVRY